MAQPVSDQPELLQYTESTILPLAFEEMRNNLSDRSIALNKLCRKLIRVTSSTMRVTYRRAGIGDIRMEVVELEEDINDSRRNFQELRRLVNVVESMTVLSSEKKATFEDLERLERDVVEDLESLKEELGKAQ